MNRWTLVNHRHLSIENKYISAKGLSEKMGISTTAVENNIAKLKKKGLLKRIGPAKGGYWKVVVKVSDI